MRALAGALVTALTLSVAAGAAPAQTATPAKPATAEPAKASPAKAARPRSATGEVVAVSQDARTMTIKQERGSPSELAFTVGPKAAKSLETVKAGDHVRVTYTEASGQMTATAIRRTHSASAKAPSK